MSLFDVETKIPEGCQDIDTQHLWKAIATRDPYHIIALHPGSQGSQGSLLN
jgi:hypothetical protein